MTSASIFGWDVGGAHLKACRLEGGEVIDVAQWPCPLWQGLEHLERALQAARARWPMLESASHAVTMTGEMVDLFRDRQDGVKRIAALMHAALAPAPVHCFAGDAGWCAAADAGARWEHIASANWLATARHAAQALGDAPGVLADIGSTTTDLIAFGAGRVLGTGRSDATRLASGELVYHGVVRTPLCALGPRIDWRGVPHNVMNEFFATTADVYRLTGELDPAHDLHPAADNAAKDAAATRQRLARMVGLDARDGTPPDWLAFAQAWRARQVSEIGGSLRQVMAAHGLPKDTAIVSAGCGSFLVPDVAAAAGGPSPLIDYGSAVARLGKAPAAGRRRLAAWARVCAPSVAVAALFEQEVG